jgi:hypothetical protein
MNPRTMMKAAATRCGFGTVVLGLLPWVATAGTYRIEVGAEMVDRAAQVVAISLPDDAPANPVLRDARGRLVGLQLEGKRAGRFVVETQKAGEVLTFALEHSATTASPVVRATQDDRQIRVEAGGSPVLAYQMTGDALPRAGIAPQYRRSGYIHPVFAPSGEVVTDDYPVKNTHHHGIWGAWSKTAFQGRTPNFWDPAEASGTVEFAGVERWWSGAVDGGFVVRQRYVDLSAPGGKTVVLHETWEVRVLAPVVPENARAHVFDLAVTQACATADPLTLGEYRYGGVGFRGRAEWWKRTSARVLNSAGETDRLKANAAKARWIFFGGIVGGGHAGVSMLDHPANPRAPQSVRVNEGLPFVCYSPVAEGALTIAPGKPYRARYRFVVEDAIPERSRIDAFWHAFARPAVVKIIPAS